MEHLAFYIPVTFILTALLTLFFLYKAGNYSKPVIIVISLWLLIQACISLSGFYAITDSMPPRFALLILPPVILIIILFLSKRGKKIIDGFNIKTLTLLHVVRIPVEITLYWLFVHKAVPQAMTFEGNNFDIFSGLTSALIYYFGFVKRSLNKKIIIAWNITCLLLLANIITTAVLSAPLPFQQFAFDQPNIALLYFPFSWLPCFVVPAVLFAHLVALRKLLTNADSNHSAK